MKKWKYYLNLGYDKESIQKIRTALDKDNIFMLKNVCMLLIAILAILIFFYTLVDFVWLRNIICIFAIMALLVTYYFADRISKNESLCKSKNVDMLLYILSAIAFAGGIYLGTIAAPNDMAVAPIWMFFFAVLIFNRLPKQNLIVLSISGIVFIICSYILKSPHHFQYDVMHAITSMVASCYVSWKKTQSKIENLLALQILASSNEQIRETVEKREKEAISLRYKASRDELSGFLTKETFENTITNILEEEQEKAHILICSDIDNFKNINDCFGHLFGDIVLKEIASTFEKEMGDDVIFGRFGGDEFLVFASDVKDIDAFLKKASRLETECTKSYKRQGKEQRISLSSGYAIFPNDGKSYFDLFEKADAALYKAKRAKKALR